MDAKRSFNLFKRRSMNNMNLNVYPENGPDFIDSADIESVVSHSNSGADEQQIVRHLRTYYNSKETSSLNSCIESTCNEANQKINNQDTNKLITNMKENGSSSSTPNCRICDNKSRRQDNYMILSCNHTFHVYCLAETHFNDVYKFHVIDSEYFGTRKCLVCKKLMQTEELMFLHSKFLNGTKDRIENHNAQIESLEAKLKDIKEDLRVCYEYKHKLEHEREKSKQIVATLMTMI
uniref:RING-type domain-containing protein n=1 Tax=viral metagenome TaxID=1070528 RepID=A0A6C0H7Z7_9ZZZZ